MILLTVEVDASEAIPARFAVFWRTTAEPPGTGARGEKWSHPFRRGFELRLSWRDPDSRREPQGRFTMKPVLIDRRKAVARWPVCEQFFGQMRA
ncbi:hypothetical protein [Bradyrhizobium sp. DASA03120]|uniref:hypothetical protein n=1 Tax=Bradyrhizobium sp. SMVTL-02 TaxID=3395917 RepID=UPI003F6E4885